MTSVNNHSENQTGNVLVGEDILPAFVIFLHSSMPITAILISAAVLSWIIGVTTHTKHISAGNEGEEVQSLDFFL